MGPSVHKTKKHIPASKVWLLEGNSNPDLKIQWDDHALSPQWLYTMLDLVRNVQMRPSWLQDEHGPLLVSEGFRYRGWELAYNQLEAEVVAMPYNPCNMDQYTQSRHPLYSFAPLPPME